MKSRTATLFVLTSLLILAGISSGYGQSGRASINGSVMDPSGAVVPGAKIVLTNIDTGQSREAVTVENGTYIIPLLPVGKYKAVCSHEGFQTETRPGIILTADEKATVDFSLAIGQTTQTLEVKGGAELINTTSGSIGQIVDQVTVVELPLNGRNPAELVFLAPGAVNGFQAGFGKQTVSTFPTETSASINGGMQGSVYYMLDGGSNMDVYENNANPFPNPDATQEFRILTNNFDAQYGFSPGAVVSIVSRSGTNSWHGGAFEFLRNEKLNARDFFAQSRDVLKRNQFGASVGGPISRDKLFIFGNYQRTTLRRAVAGGGTAGFVPNNKMINGDFSDVCSNSGGTMDSVTGMCSVAGGQLRDPDTGVAVPFNYFDPSTFSPTAMNFVNLTLPRTDDPTGATPLTGRVAIQNYHEFTIKSDWYLNNKNHISGRAFYDYFYTPPFPAPGNIVIATPDLKAPYHNYSANWASTISPNLINNFVFSYTRLNVLSLPSFKTVDGGPVCGKCMGMNVEEYPDTAPNLIMYTNGFWATHNTNRIDRHNFSLAESITSVKGKHTIVGGVDYHSQFMDQGTDWLADEIMAFDGRYSGSDFSDFMLGRLSYFQQGAGQFFVVTGGDWAPYVQDSIRLKPNLNVNLGLRWEPFIPLHNRAGRIAAFRPGQQSSRYPGAPVGLVFPGDAGVTDSGTRGNIYNNFSPRISIAWQPKSLPNTSIRAAFGIFMAPQDYMRHNANPDSQPFAPNFNVDPPAGGIPFDDPWSIYAPTNFKSPFPSPFPFSTSDYAPPSDFTFVLPVTIEANFDGDFQSPRVQTWNFSVEHQFAGNTLFRAAYVGSQSYHLYSYNWSNPGVFNPDPALSGKRIYSDFGSVNTRVSWGVGSYHGLQLTLEKRLSRGLQFTSNYTWSKAIDNVSATGSGIGYSFSNPFDPSFDRGLAQVHFPHIWASNWVYQLPDLKGSNKFVRSVLGSWEVSGIYRLQSGRTFSISGGNGRLADGSPGTGNISGTLVGAERADLTGQPFNVHQGSKGEWLNSYFNKAAFQPALMGTFGNSGRGILAAPGQNVCDLGIYKNIPFKERYRVQFRMQMYNAFNRPHFARPNSNPSSSAFGRIFSTMGYDNGNGGGQDQSAYGVPARLIEFGLKLYW